MTHFQICYLFAIGFTILSKLDDLLKRPTSSFIYAIFALGAIVWAFFP